MSRKYFGYKRLEEHYHAQLYNECAGKDGSMLAIAFDNGVFSVTRVFCGSDIDYEYSHEGEVEQSWYLNEENTNMLMLRTGTHNGRELIAELERRYKDNGFLLPTE